MHTHGALTPTASAAVPQQKLSTNMARCGLDGMRAAAPDINVQSGPAHHSVPSVNLGCGMCRREASGTLSALNRFLTGSSGCSSEGGGGWGPEVVVGPTEIPCDGELLPEDADDEIHCQGPCRFRPSETTLPEDSD